MTKHSLISFVKSGIRIAGCLLALLALHANHTNDSIFILASFLGVAELLGIAEELGAKYE